METTNNLDAQKPHSLSSTLSSSSSPTSDALYLASADDQSLPPLVWPSPLYSEQALAPPHGTVREDIDVLGQFTQHDIIPSQSFLQAPPVPHIQQSYQAARAFSPHVFYQRPPPSTLTPFHNGAFVTDSPASPSPTSTASRIHTFAVTPQQPSSEQLPFSIAANASQVVANAEPDDAAWNLVQSNAPWKPRGGSSSADGGSSGLMPSVMMETSGMFMRSPTPTKRQRTNQACEKCRDRKAKCNGGRPTCARCALRGLVCEYAKQRRMRGPNRGGASNSSSEHQRTSSSPASNGPPSILISNGPGDSRSERPRGGRVGTPPVATRPHSLKSARSGIARATHPSPLTLNIPLPIHRTIHVAQSFPDLHSETSRASDISSTSSSPISVVSFPHSADAYTNRPRSHTTPYSLPTTAMPAHIQYQLQQTNGHLSHLCHGFRSGSSDVSLSEPSEPPSATGSAFGADVYAYSASTSYPIPVAMPMIDHTGHSPPNNGGFNHGHDEPLGYHRSNLGFNTGNMTNGDAGSGRSSEDTVYQNRGNDPVDEHGMGDVAHDGFDGGEQNWGDVPIGWGGERPVIGMQKVHAGELMELRSAPASLPSSASPMSYGYESQLSLPFATWDHNNLPVPHDLSTDQMPHLELARMTVNPQSATPSNYLWVSGEANLRETGHPFHSPTDNDFKAWFDETSEMAYGQCNDHKTAGTAFDIAAAGDTARNIDVYEVLDQ
ncbi:hypothetical protein FRB96_009260 [Tulasnella sp. 330]|nr:hypothetical protein FRB96_009260 [Tulasnella sp. 330]